MNKVENGDFLGLRCLDPVDASRGEDTLSSYADVLYFPYLSANSGKGEGTLAVPPVKPGDAGGEAITGEVVGINPTPTAKCSGRLDSGLNRADDVDANAGDGGGIGKSSFVDDGGGVIV
jgi:hypothetical protein